jgi:retron-type reverse transcriptase
MENNRLGVLGSVHESLYEEIVSKENLFAAWREFQRGKTSKIDVLIFMQNFESHLLDLHYDLVRGTYTHDPYTRFFIHDPKQRKIAKGSVRDRVLHHSICRVLIPMFDKSFIFDSYSSRTEKGTHAAGERFRRMAWRLSRNNTQVVWMLKCDIRKFFEGVNHDILLKLCAKKVRDKKLLALIYQILDSYHSLPGKGIPLGNLTSQLFANIYLNELDQFIKRILRVKNYLRYTDDFILMSRDKGELERALPLVRDFLTNHLALELHPTKVTFRKWHQGVDFLGYVHFPYFQVIRTNTKKRIFRKLRKRLEELQTGEIDNETFSQSLQSFLGVLSHSRSRGIVRQINREFSSKIVKDNNRIRPYQNP